MMGAEKMKIPLISNFVVTMIAWTVIVIVVARIGQSDLIELRSESCPRPKYYLAATPLTTTGFIHSI